ncbi:pleiotropic drug resistance family ABC transporter Ecym_3605 [Eremothecium cymbalariae DBVPG|uniref:ABC transporter domain-containing protein n=1 Tax=Eremothecium cymbalariae (strain CBS 270.75 / DBVPG 7215 / KCTC 17166 / NRRL Y-17582) TaxID=931890 RepID=G8JQT4_ERECY|nr:Hypothetical protein Ecym_3605 [Eremothecium cymbalariae DBVPG\
MDTKLYKFIPEGDTLQEGESADGLAQHRPYLGLEEDAEEQENIRSLARTLTGSSGGSTVNVQHGYISGTADELAAIGIGSDPRLDPESEEFDSRFWVRSMRKLFVGDRERYKPTELGVCLKGLRVSGSAGDTDYQATVLTWPLKYVQSMYARMPWCKNRQEAMFDIIKPLDALFMPGRLCVVLGRPGAGCSSLLKTVAARTYGFEVRPESVISYDGISQKDISKNFRGDVIYSAEMDSHFANLPVGYTLEFAARCRCPQVRPGGVSREEYYKHYAAVVMATYGLSHTYNTKVGNDYIRGVSGGERKRVSLAEITLAGAKVQCWDNSTRGLDSATALEFVRALKTNAEVLRTTPLIAIYQCSQDAYELFDDVLLLYEGYEIYFGTASAAEEYFVEMGWECPAQQSTADFLTSVTAPAERRARAGYEEKVPRTAKEFYERWQGSKERAELCGQIEEYLRHQSGGEGRKQLAEYHSNRQAGRLSSKSPYLITFWMQFWTLVDRNWKRILGDPSVYLFMILSNSFMGLILASTFFNQKQNTESFFFRGSALYTAILFNSFSSFLEIMSLFEARKIVEKHKTYAFYHPAADALASIYTELPAKILICLCFNLVFYFMVNLRRSAGAFFFYMLVSLTSTFAMSHLFRTIGAACTSLYVTMTPASILLLAISLYVGFVIPQHNILGWSKWIFYLNPIARSMEAMFANEFHGRQFDCSRFVPSGPGYESVSVDNQVCAVIGAVPGQSTVSGTRYMELAYGYRNSHKWRNWAIVVLYAVVFLFFYLVLIEYNKGEMQKGEVVLFTRSTMKKLKRKNKNKKGEQGDLESNGIPTKESSDIDNDGVASDSLIQKIGSDDIFHWRNVCYDVQIKKETRRILNGVDGWVKPGTLTALMGCSGAGKTTLLDVLANRVKVGVITGNMFVNGLPRDASFQRNTGYCQQQDLHGRTQTVREALRFSAYLRQPEATPRAEKDAYVEDIIRLLEMEAYADAVVGVTGEGLNVEQRKRLTIGVELVARPKLLLFLDEPTSGLDSQTAWSICQLMRKLATHGQAVLCTIHQPSAILMQEFDRLLLLASGGRTVYFGELGKGCQTMIDYFESHGSQKFPENCNPAEFMLEIIGAAPGSHATQDYHEVWKSSEEFQSVQRELENMESELCKKPRDESPDSQKEFATSLWTQYKVVSKRVWQQIWRSPTYIWSKFLMGIFSALFIGFSFFNSSTSTQGLQNQMFSIFLFMMILNPLIQQMLPQYEEQRDLYEVRERPSKTFSWKAFILSQITTEMPWSILVGTLAFFCFYYPVGFYHNAAASGETASRGALFWLLCVTYYIFSITFGQLCVAAIQRHENGAIIANFFFMLCLSFCGVLVTKEKLPKFWIWMYYLSPITYVVSAFMSTGAAKAQIKCTADELVKFFPPSGTTCEEYIRPYLSTHPAYFTGTEGDSGLCSLCVMNKSDVYLASVNIYYKDRYRNWGIFFCYCIVNMIGFAFLYWYFRVPKSRKVKTHN